VLVVILSDENDCSIRDGKYESEDPIFGQAYLSTRAAPPPRASSACASDPNSACCYPCPLGTPSGCPPKNTDSECAKGDFYGGQEDRLNLRCWDQKRRFGVDWLVPIERYVNGFTQPQIENRLGQMVENPLLAGGRDPRQVTVTGIVGVPWQYLARDPQSPTLSLRSAAELDSRWSDIAGDPAQYVAPKDPFMVESPEPRSGQSTLVSGASTQPPGSGPNASTINGHEWNTSATETGDLQYSCIFPLPAPRPCATTTGGCDCKSQPDPNATQNPLCQASDGSYSTTQYYAKAYPGLRVLGLLHGVGEQAVVGSICPQNTSDPNSPNFGYRPVMRAVEERMQLLLE
jgi:hypothetical protein